MRKITQSPLARSDVKGIVRYTRKKWGERQARTYALEIAGMIESLAEHPHKGEGIDHVREGYRKKLVGKHFIIYRVTDTQVAIVRVLKQDMDIRRHLN